MRHDFGDFEWNGFTKVLVVFYCFNATTRLKRIYLLYTVIHIRPRDRESMLGDKGGRRALHQ